MRKLSKGFVAIPVCLTDGKNTKNDKDEIGFFKAESIIGCIPGYAWGAIVYLSSGTTFLTRATCAQVLEAMDNQQVDLKTFKK